MEGKGRDGEGGSSGRGRGVIEWGRVEGKGRDGGNGGEVKGWKEWEEGVGVKGKGNGEGHVEGCRRDGNEEEKGIEERIE